MRNQKCLLLAVEQGDERISALLKQAMDLEMDYEVFHTGNTALQCAKHLDFACGQSRKVRQAGCYHLYDSIGNLLEITHTAKEKVLALVVNFRHLALVD